MTVDRDWLVRVGSVGYVDRHGLAVGQRAGAYRFSKGGAELYIRESRDRWPGLSLTLEQAPKRDRLATRRSK